MEGSNYYGCRPSTPIWQEMFQSYEEDVQNITDLKSQDIFSEDFSGCESVSGIEMAINETSSDSNNENSSNAPTSVREIIKKFNAVRETTDELGSEKTESSCLYPIEMGGDVENHVVADEPKPRSARITEIIKKLEGSKDENSVKNRAVAGAKPDLFQLIANDQNVEMNGARNISSPQALSLNNAVYKSQTTVTKTTKGIRVMIDINLDEQGNELETGGTAAPHSEILAEFQKNASLLLSSNPPLLMLAAPQPITEDSAYFRLMQNNLNRKDN